MGKGIRLGIIGAGSAVFSLGLVRDLCSTEDLYGSTITMMDVDEERLDSIHKLATRYVDELKVDLKFEKTLSREAALKDADFVINTALHGGHSNHEAQRELAQEPQTAQERQSTLDEALQYYKDEIPGWLEAQDRLDTTIYEPFHDHNIGFDR